MKEDLDLEVFTINSTLLIDSILNANCTHSSLKGVQELAREKKQGLMLEDGLLFCLGLLVVLDTEENLCTQLIQEAYILILLAHPSPGKIIKMLRTRYFWRIIRSNITQYIANCHKCY